jgi:hypothetical protein
MLIVAATHDMYFKHYRGNQTVLEGFNCYCLPLRTCGTVSAGNAPAG